MLITRIELQNTKSYCDIVVTFTEGTNAICGENGAGKSTLLEAIGFTLFDYLPYAQANFVREGEKTATVAVSLISNQDGREYQIVRRCGGSSDYYVYDPELDAQVASRKVDVLDWLKEHLGVEPTTDLTALFRDAVGVPQGLLTVPFLQTSSQRKPLFDRLLRVDEYEQAWKTLRETLRHLEEKIAGHKERIAGLESQVQRLPGMRQRAEMLHTDMTRIEIRLVDLRAELAEATALRESLEATKNDLDRLLQKAEMLATRLEGIGEQLMAAEKAEAEAEAAQATVEACRSAYAAYEAAQTALSELEAKRKQRDQLLSDQASQEKSLALAQERVKGLEANHLEIEEAETQMETIQPQLERQQELQAAVNTAQEEVRALEMAQTRSTERQARLDDLKARLEAVELGLGAADKVQVELRQARAELEKTRQFLTELKSNRAALGAEVARLTEQTQTLETTEAANCPVCEQPLTAEHRADLLARNRTRLDELRAQDQMLAEKIGATAETTSALERQAQNLDAQLRDLPRSSDKEELVAQSANLEDELAPIQASVERLMGSRKEAAHLKRELAELGDPRRQYERLAEKVSQRADLEERLDAERHAVNALEASLVEIERALTPFAELDRRLAEQRGMLSQHEEDHRHYLENAKIAAALPGRREQAESLRTQQIELTAERDETRTQAEEVAIQFDPEALATARQREAGLKAEQAGLEGQLGRLRQEVEETEREIEELEAAERALTAEQATLAERQKLLTLMEFIRQVIRQAGPHVTRRLLQQVSLEAAHLFADIMADPSARLRWEKNYEIVLEKNGRDRSFQQLSGGEQMAAALAVRLALLRELSAIDVAFFDEPTSNLDDTRRDSLAEQVLAVKGFSQLFVISHDDTFERVTNNVVRVRKEDGVSKVEME
ncbi:MAG: AAA family ATPase [Anaerolineae bacterium]|jgi:exonuclease SbcC